MLQGFKRFECLSGMQAYIKVSWICEIQSFYIQMELKGFFYDIICWPLIIFLAPRKNVTLTYNYQDFFYWYLLNSRNTMLIWFIYINDFNACIVQTYFEDNPRDLQVLRHDKSLHTVKVQKHLKNVPDYLGKQLKNYP